MTGDKTNLAHGSFLPRFLARRLGECCVQNKTHTTNVYSVVEYTVSNWALGNLENFKGLRTNLPQVLTTNAMKSTLRRHTTFYMTINTKAKVVPCSL